MGPIGCPETSVRNYHDPLLCNNPEAVVSFLISYAHVEILVHSYQGIIRSCTSIYGTVLLNGKGECLYFVSNSRNSLKRSKFDAVKCRVIIHVTG